MATPRKQQPVRWRAEPEDKDYPAARAYLSLSLRPADAKAVVAKLKKARITAFSAKDLFRASGLPTEGMGGGHVQKEKTLILAGKKLSPVLLYRDRRNGKLIIVDGYHRLCAVYDMDEDATIPCMIV
jgi:hypothetical protein